MIKYINKNRNKIYPLLFFTVLLSVLGFNSFKIAKASNLKTITVTFKTNPDPSTVNVIKSPLKYNKRFAFSYTLDDGYAEGYNPFFRYLNGGYVNELGQVAGGLYYSDGAGNSVPFKGSFNWFSNSSSNFLDLHVNTPGNMTWDNLREAYSYGWEPINHGWTSISTPNPPNTIINYPEPHGPSSIDYNYEITQNTNRLLAEIGFEIKHFGLPNGDVLYLPHALDNGMRTISIGQPGGNENEGLMNVSGDLDLNQLQYKRKYFAESSTFLEMKNYIDKIFSDSVGSNNFWGVAFSHRVRTPPGSTDFGNIPFSVFKQFMDYVFNTYGVYGNDSVWVASVPEIYEYLVTRQKTTVDHVLNGRVLTISMDTSLVDDDLRRYALSLVVEADAEIESITYDEPEFTYHSENISTGLINLDWGFVSLRNDLTRVEEMVNTAENLKTLSSINNARAYVNLLNSTYQSTEKDFYNGRLNSINVPNRTWYIKTRADFTSAANANSYTSNTASYSPSIYNWNNFGMVRNSTINPAGNDLISLKDSDGLISSVSLSNTAPFNHGGLVSNSTGGNLGLYPDAVISSNAQVYAATTTPAKIKIYGLDNSKSYNIKLFGYTSATGKTGDSATTQYIIGDITKELYVRENTSNYVLFESVYPTDGQIEFSVKPKVAAWGYGLLNAFEIIENPLLPPSGLSYSSPNVYTKGVSSVYLLPSVVGSGLTYSIYPSLPSGLNFNSSTGEISGTPQVAMPPTYFTVTAYNSSGDVSSAVNLEVRNAAPSNLSYNLNNEFTRGVAISPLIPSVIGEDLVFSINPNLPEGIYLNTETGFISGTPAFPLDTTTFTLTASNTGGFASFNIYVKINNVFNVVYGIDSGGTLSGETKQKITQGYDGTEVLAIPDNGYVFESWSDGVTSPSRKDINIQEDKTLTALFSLISYTVSSSAGTGGTISGAQTINHGSTASFTVTPNTGYSISSVTGCGGTLSGNTYTTGAITANCTVSASFSLNSYTVSTSVGAGGSVSPTSASVNHGSTTSFTITPNTGYSIASASGCGGTRSGNLYNIDLVQSDCEVKVSFAILSDRNITNRSIGSSALTRYNNMLSWNNVSGANELAKEFLDNFSNPGKEVPGKNKIIFTRNLKMRDFGDEVLELQKFLNQSGFIVSKEGPGSKGKETNYFGSLTRKAVINFQIANGLKGDGVVGPATRLKLNSL